MPHPLSSRKCKGNQPWAPTTHTLERSKLGARVPPNAGKDVEQEQLISNTLLVGMQNGIATLGDSLADSYKTKTYLNNPFSKHTPWYSPEGAESLCPHKNLTQIFSNFIHNCQNLEATKMPFSASVGQRLNKLWYIQTMRYYSVPKRKELPSHEKNMEKTECTLLSERT